MKKDFLTVTPDSGSGNATVTVVFSSVDGLGARVSLQSLFPDNGYSNESGGDPDFIPELTYEQYLDFHRKYYHPSNSYIYLYGDMDVVERLQWIDENYLSKYDYLEVDSEIKYQKPFDKPVTVTKEYAISDSENEDERDRKSTRLNSSH